MIFLFLIPFDPDMHGIKTKIFFPYSVILFIKNIDEYEKK